MRRSNGQAAIVSTITSGFRTVISAKAFAKLIAGNDALDVVSEAESCLVVVSHATWTSDRGYILGAAQALGRRIDHIDRRWWNRCEMARVATVDIVADLTGP